MLKAVHPKERIDPTNLPILGQAPKTKEYVCPKCGSVATLPVGAPTDTTGPFLIVLGGKGAAFCVKCLVEFWAAHVPTMRPLVKEETGEQAGE